MKQSDIGKKMGVSAMFVSDLVRSKKCTTDKNLAIEVSHLTGKPPIEHVSEKLRTQYLEAWPELEETPGEGS
jgi:hypothetical protein